jgi:hypothetical protein
MAMTNKTSFIVHLDSLDVIDDLSDEQCGELLRAMKAYHSGIEFIPSSIVKVAFSPFRNQFKRDAKKYDSIVERNRINGLKGGRPKKEEKPTGLFGNPDEPKKADSGSKSDNDSDSKKENLSPKIKFSDDDLSLAETIYIKIKEVAPKTKVPNYNSWADSIRLMREQDGHTASEIKAVFMWANSDSFWRTNILSPSKLRDKFADLHAKMGNKPIDKHNGFAEKNYQDGATDINTLEWMK